MDASILNYTVNDNVGKFLKQTGGGNPKTIGKQALGKGLGVAKDILRGALFGEGAQEAVVQANLNYAVESTDNENTYSKANNSKRLKSDKTLAKPKSNNFNVPSARKPILSGFKSRCATPCSWQYNTPLTS